MTLPIWHHLNGEPETQGQLKTKNCDFKVFEDLGYSADGQGEHLYLVIEKDGLNSAYVAKLIARWAGVTQREIGYAGKKDRYGVTRQTFSVQLPGKESPDISTLETPQLRVLSAKRSSKKIRTGALKGNDFELLIRKLTLDDALEARLAAVKLLGVPNYFGLQRFGKNGGNIINAHELFKGKKVKNRDLRSIYLSSARSLIFNNVASARLQGEFSLQPMMGDVFMLNGSKASFKPEVNDEDIINRLAQQDILLSGPLWGAGKNKVTDDALAFELGIIKQEEELAAGLEDFGLKHERRSLVVIPTGMAWRDTSEGLHLTFSLPAGSYATSVLREITQVTDMSLVNEEW